MTAFLGHHEAVEGTVKFSVDSQIHAAGPSVRSEARVLFFQRVENAEAADATLLRIAQDSHLRAPPASAGKARNSARAPAKYGDNHGTDADDINMQQGASRSDDCPVVDQ